MSELSLNTKLKELIGIVIEGEVTDLASDTPLELDSIQRISLIVEIENSFDIEFSEDELVPEIFETLDSLSIGLEPLLT